MQGICASPIGMQGNEQVVSLSDNCDTSSAIHEIGHAVGLWHEQSRADRDKYIRILWDKIDPNFLHNFDQHITDGDDVGKYDYCSAMHYGVVAFPKIQGQQTIEILQPIEPCGNANSIGYKNRLSSEDRAAVVEMYGNVAPIVITNSSGRLEVFTVNKDGDLCYKRQTSPSDSSKWDDKWTPLNLKFFLSVIRPTVIRQPSDSLDIFWTYMNVLHYAYQTDPNSSFVRGEISNPRLPEHLGDPVVARDSNNKLEVFMTGNDDSKQLYYCAEKSTSGYILDYFHPLGGHASPNRRPAVIRRKADGILEVFMVSLEDKLYHRWQTTWNNNTGSYDWSNWVELVGEAIAGDPVIAQNADGRLELFVIRSANRELYHRWQTTLDSNTGRYDWSIFESLGGYWSPRKRPAVALNSDGMLELFIMGKNEQLYHTWQTARDSKTGKPNWVTNWERIEEKKKTVDGKTEIQKWPLSSTPTLARNADGKLDLFMMDKDGKVNHRWQTSKNSNGTWNWSDNWTEL